MNLYYYNALIMTKEQRSESQSRLANIYKGTLVPTIEPTSLDKNGLPHTPDGILHCVERQWLGAEGAMLVERHIKEGVLYIERPNLHLAINATTKEGDKCPIVWGVSVEKENGDDIVEPHLLVPEGKEVIINVNSTEQHRLALLGIYDEESMQAGMPPIRKPLLEHDGKVEMYVGGQGKNIVVFWKDMQWGNLRVITPVKSVGGDLSTIEEGAPEVALHGGLYLITIPEKTPPVPLEFNDIFEYGGGLRGGNLFSGQMRGMSFRGDDIFKGGSLRSETRGRAGGLTQGELQGRGGTTEFEPNTQDIIPFILRIRVTGELPSYLHPATVTVNTESSIVVKGAICSHCGVTAPKNSYTWVANEFRPEKFDCGRCGSGSLEPVIYRKKVKKTPQR
jgi:hypothetical protein